MRQYSLVVPQSVHVGCGATEKVTEILEHEGAKKIALFTDKSILGLGLTKSVEEAIQKAGGERILFDDLAAEPTVYQADAVIKRFMDCGADFIIAIGGGSVMDIAKLCSILVHSPYTVFDLLETPGIARKSVRTLMIPTTAGTGSEATPNSIVCVPERELKVGIVNTSMIPDYVVLDPEMIRNLPFSIAAATGIDALAHAMECYTSNKATPLSDLFALEACRLIFRNIVRACADPGALDEKEAMQLAAFYGGVAIANSGTTIVHALAYPLGGKYHIAHGVSNAMLLAAGMEFNKPCCTQRLAQIYDAVYPGDSQADAAEKADRIIAKLQEIVAELKIPTDLKQYGVPPEDLEELVRSGMEVQRLLVNNCRPVTADDAREIYRKLLF